MRLMCLINAMIDYVLNCFLLFFDDPAPPEIYSLSLHDALPISGSRDDLSPRPAPAGHGGPPAHRARARRRPRGPRCRRSEEHTSELQSRPHLVCRLLLEKKKATHLMPLVATSTAFVLLF